MNNSLVSVENLTQKLISIPSYVDETHDESALGDFLVDFLEENCPSLVVSREYFDPESKRANIVAKGRNNPKLFVLGHMDTVRPKDDWLTNPLQPVIQKGDLYGLGAADMKGSLAAFLCAISQAEVSVLDDVMLLLYCDEEYDFKGIKRFIQTQELSANPPELIISLDGSLAVSSGCRGLIEINAQVTGVSGHASNPRNGINAITKTTRAVEKLEKIIQTYRDLDLGKSSLNLAYLRGGIMERQGETEIWQREGNVIPDYVDMTVEIRTANTLLNAAKAIELLESECRRQGLDVKATSVRHDLSLWPVSYGSSKIDFLKTCYEEANVRFVLTDRKSSGFIDVQMLNEWVDVPTFVVGAGGENKHGANEYVPTDNLTKAVAIYKVMLMKLGGL